MKKIIITLSLVLFSTILSQAKNNLSSPDKLSITKSISNKSNGKHLTQKSKTDVNCGLEGQVWSQTQVYDCPDGTTSTVIYSGIVWELTCSGEITGSVYVVFCTDVDYFYVGGSC